MLLESLRAAFQGRLGDGNLHYNVSPLAQTPEHAAEFRALEGPLGLMNPGKLLKFE